MLRFAYAEDWRKLHLNLLKSMLGSQKQFSFSAQILNKVGTGFFLDRCVERVFQWSFPVKCVCSIRYIQDDSCKLRFVP